MNWIVVSYNFSKILYIRSVNFPFGQLSYHFVLIVKFYIFLRKKQIILFVIIGCLNIGKCGRGGKMTNLIKKLFRKS